MLAAGIVVVLLLFGVWYCRVEKERPLDEDELRFVRRLSDRNRAEEEIFH
jgi:hypothetical protein